METLLSLFLMIWVVLVLILLWSSGLLFIMRTFITASISSLVSYLPHLGLVLKCYRSRNLCISFKLPVSLNVDFQSMSLYFLNLINISSASPFHFFILLICVFSPFYWWYGFENLVYPFKESSLCSLYIIFFISI